MNSIELFGKNIELRETGCTFYNSPAKNIEGKRLNLFIQTTSTCNANCLFCEYHTCGKSEQFDYKKLSDVFNEIADRATLGKLNFTGGEPLLDFNNFEKIMEISLENLDKYRQFPEITVNTNGINLLKLLKYIDSIDSIGLSRHHYYDETNYSIFGTRTVANSSIIREFQASSPNKYKLHSRCNLIRGYIDDLNSVKMYLENWGELGIIWAGFVTLMPLNQFCIDNEVCAEKLIADPEFYRNELWNRFEKGKLECQCADYLYVTNNGKLVRFYNRIFCNNTLNAGQLVFDGKYLRNGFGGEIIY